MRGYPLNDFILVEPEEVKEKKSEGGIILTGKAPVSYKGTVFSISKDLEDAGFSVGDTVIYNAYADDVIEIDNVEYLIIRKKDLKFVIPQ